MELKNSKFREKYGPWALVAGASVGLGAEFARQLAARGLNLILVARGREKLEEHARTLARHYGVETKTVAADLGSPDVLEKLRKHTDGLEVGLLVYNAARSHIGPFMEQDLEDKLKIIDVNCRGPIMLAHEFGRTMAERGRGGMLFMSSLAGLHGYPLVASYAATKAFDFILGVALWSELRSRGVDVLSFCAGPTRTPGYEESERDHGGVPSFLVMEAGPVVTEALEALGRGPTGIAGLANSLTVHVTQRLLPRRLAASAMSLVMRTVYSREKL